MHCCCKGVSSRAVGCGLWAIIYDGDRATTIDACLDKLWDEIKYWYDTLGIPNRLNSLRLTMFVNPGDFPELSARAAETRSLVPVMAHVCAAHNNGSERDGHRLKVFEALARFYELIEGGCYS